MRKGQIFIGVTILLVGLILLLGAIFNVNAWRFLCPILVILLGVWLLLRPRLIGPGVTFHTKLLGDIRRRGTWQVTDEEIWTGVGDVRLDLTNAEIPVGEKRIRAFGFVGDVTLIVPKDVGVSISSTSFVTDTKIFGQKRGQFLAPLRFTSKGYETAERKVRLDVSYFVADLKVRQAKEPA